MTACSAVTTTSSSSSSANCTSSTTLIARASLPTISLHDTAAAHHALQRLTARDAPTDDVTTDDVTVDDVAESKSVPRVGHDRKKHHASYRSAVGGDNTNGTNRLWYLTRLKPNQGQRTREFQGSEKVPTEPQQPATKTAKWLYF